LFNANLNSLFLKVQLTVLIWGAILSIQVRRARISIKETKLITWAIFNESAVCTIVIGINLIFKYTSISPYFYFIFNFLRIHLAITVMLLLIFSYKVILN
jgi:hypothetical protein